MSTAASPPSERPLLLASGSAIRLAILRAAGLDVTARAARIDEEGLRAALEAEGAAPRDIADALAEAKARKLAAPGALTLGCDQVLAFEGRAWGKPATPGEARAQIARLQGRRHDLLSALVLYDGTAPVWRHVGVARLTMRRLSDAWLDAYVARNWDRIRHSLGGYRIEEEGIRLFAAVEGDTPTIQGLPIVPLLDYLGLRGFIAT